MRLRWYVKAVFKYLKDNWRAIKSAMCVSRGGTFGKYNQMMDNNHEAKFNALCITWINFSYREMESVILSGSNFPITGKIL